MDGLLRAVNPSSEKIHCSPSFQFAFGKLTNQVVTPPTAERLKGELPEVSITLPLTARDSITCIDEVSASG
jgi:hypothetical protein